MAYTLEILTDGRGEVSSVVDPNNENKYILTASPATYHNFKYFEVLQYLTDENGDKFFDDKSAILKAFTDDNIIETNPYEITLSADTVVRAYFEEFPKYHITVSPSIEFGSIYVSRNDWYSGYESTLWARPYPGYHFVSWSDGSTLNPRSVTVTRDVFYIAQYALDLDSSAIYQYRCFIKDQMNLTNPPKAFLRVSSFNIKEDLMTNSNSTIEVYDLDNEYIQNGDIVVVYDPRGNTLYNGVIKSIEPLSKNYKIKKNLKYRITCSQMQSFYKGEWIYEKGETPPNTFNNSWLWERFEKLEATYPSISDFEALTALETANYTNEYSNSKWNTWNINKADQYSARCTTYLWCDRPILKYIVFATDGNGTVALNDQTIAELDEGSTNAVAVQCAFVKGMNKLQVCYTETTGGDGWKMYLNYTAFDPYDSKKTYAVGDYVQYDNKLYQCKTAITTAEKWTSSHWNNITTENVNVVTNDAHILGINSTNDQSLCLEAALKNILADYSNGIIVGSDYIDPQVARRLSGITPHYVESTTGVSLPTYEVGSTVDFESFIYSMYEKHGIIFDFNIAVSGENTVTIRIPEGPIDDPDVPSIGNNTYAIKEMKPITTVEETNRLIIFASDNVTYRTTYVATETTNEEEPASTLGRFELTNTVIVFSDDPVQDLIADNLPNQMFNHQISLTMLVKNFVYDYKKFKLGALINIYYNDDVYKSVYTGFEVNKGENQNVSEIHMICGKVRQKLTKKLTLGKV